MFKKTFLLMLSVFAILPFAGQVSAATTQEIKANDDNVAWWGGRGWGYGRGYGYGGGYGGYYGYGSYSGCSDCGSSYYPYSYGYGCSGCNSGCGCGGCY